MTRNYRVLTKAAPASPWRDSGIIESNKGAAEKAWEDIVRRLRYHAFKLEPITFGVAYERS